MDNLCLDVLCKELRPSLLRSSIQKIRFSSDGVLVFNLRRPAPPYLVVSLHPISPLVFLSQQEISVQSNPSEFLMVLRKRMQGGKILDFNKKAADRILVLDVETHSYLDQPERSRLILQFIPHRLNLILLNAADEVVISALPLREDKRFATAARVSDHPANSRPLDQITKEDLANLFHQLRRPETSRKLEGAVATESPELLHSAQSSSDLRQLPELAGLTPAFRREFQSKSRRTTDLLWVEFQSLLRLYQEGPYSPRIYFKSGALEDVSKRGGIGHLISDIQAISPIPLDHLAGHPYVSFSSLNELSAELFHAFRQWTFRQQREKALKTTLTALLKKQQRLKEALLKDLAKNLERERYQKYSNLLFAQSNGSTKGKDRITVPDLFDPSRGEVEVPLDPQWTLIENASRYARLYQKANRAVPLIRGRLQKIEQEIALLHARRDCIGKSGKMGDPLDDPISQDSKRASPDRTSTEIKTSRTSSSRQTVPARSNSLKKSAKIFHSSEGMEIWVGKNSRENDVLTFKLSNPEDFWLHVASYGGSHVILRNPKCLTTAPGQSLKEAAELAAYFSQARNATKVEVHHTQRKFVTKPKRSKAGLVLLRRYETVRVHPRCDLESKVV
ncbi:MAG: NFACT RNA binding domain-containing protein [Terriglobia bacterium]